MRKTILLLARSVLVASVACSGEARPGGDSFEITDSAGITIVTNHAAIWSGREGWIVEPTPIARIGLGPSEAEQFFGLRRVRLRSDGGIAVLDDGSSELRLFHPDGTLDRVVARRGDGPGELRGPRDLYVLRGDSLLVWDSRVWASRFDSHGEFASRHQVDVTAIRARMPDRMTVGYRGLPDGSVLAVGYAPPLDVAGRVRNRMLYARADRDGIGFDTLGASLDREWWVPTSGRGRGRTLLGPQSHWAAGGDPPQIALGESETPAVHIYGADGAPERIVRFPDGDRSVPAGALAAAVADRRAVPMPGPNLERFLAEAPEPDRVPAFGGLILDDEGYLWVLSYYPDEGGAEWSRTPTANGVRPGRPLHGHCRVAEAADPP